MIFTPSVIGPVSHLHAEEAHGKPNGVWTSLFEDIKNLCGSVPATVRPGSTAKTSYSSHTAKSLLCSRFLLKLLVNIGLSITSVMV